MPDLMQQIESNAPKELLLKETEGVENKNKLLPFWSSFSPVDTEKQKLVWKLPKVGG